jgi:hypothetical protein
MTGMSHLFVMGHPLSGNLIGRAYPAQMTNEWDVPLQKMMAGTSHLPVMGHPLLGK